MPRLVTEWSTQDPQLAETLKTIASFPERSVERLELEAILHTQQAAWCYQRIGEIRQFESQRRGGGRRKTSEVVADGD
jgi:uncharacterized protein YecT (DUF1311 family)